MPREIEIKLPVPSAAKGRHMLRAAGFQIFRRRVFEANTLFDTSDQSLRRAGSLLRVREAGPQGILTYKGPAMPGKHKDREELEVEISDARQFSELLSRVGFQPVLRYEKYRTEFRHPSQAGLAMLDETPIGVYLELEGPPAWIDRNARALGFRESDYITLSYFELYRRFCRQHDLRPGHMTFQLTGSHSSSSQ
jgi:adenylate cyclase class 2